MKWIIMEYPFIQGYFINHKTYFLKFNTVKYFVYFFKMLLQFLQSMSLLSFNVIVHPLRCKDKIMNNNLGNFCTLNRSCSLLLRRSGSLIKELLVSLSCSLQIAKLLYNIHCKVTIWIRTLSSIKSLLS